MRKILLLVLLFPIFCHGQHIYTDKVDEFTGTRIIITYSTKINDSPKSLAVETICYINKEDTLFSLRFSFETKSLTSNRDGKLFLKLENDKVLKSEYTGDYQIYNPNEMSIIYFNLTDSDTKKIIDSHVSKIRIETSNDLYDYALSGSSLSVIDQQIMAIKNLLKM